MGRSRSSSSKNATRPCCRSARLKLRQLAANRLRLVLSLLGIETVGHM